MLAALFARERTGTGQRVDASIYGTLIAMQGIEINYTSISGEEPASAPAAGHQFLHGVWGAFRTSDGHPLYRGHRRPAMAAFCRIMGIQHLENDLEFHNVIRNFHG